MANPVPAFRCFFLHDDGQASFRGMRRQCFFELAVSGQERNQDVSNIQSILPVPQMLVFLDSSTMCCPMDTLTKTLFALGP
jgi:hypothetical protein